MPKTVLALSALKMLIAGNLKFWKCKIEVNNAL
jgi:hypothetical protein